MRSVNGGFSKPMEISIVHLQKYAVYLLVYKMPSSKVTPKKMRPQFPGSMDAEVMYLLNISYLHLGGIL